MEFADLKRGMRVSGLLAGSDVEIVAVEGSEGAIANVVFRDDKGNLIDRLVTADETREDEENPS